MFRDDYREELNRLVLSDEFKNETIRLMKEKAENAPAASRPKSITFPRKITAAVAAAAVAVITISAAGMYAMGNMQASSAETADAAAFSSNNTESLKEEGIDACEQKQVYTIADAQPLAKSAPDEKAMYDAGPVTYNMSYGGMGYEGYTVYDVNSLDIPVYSVGEEPESLPVYVFSPLSPQRSVESAEKILNSVDIEMPQAKYIWTRSVYRQDGQLYTTETAVTYDLSAPGDDYVLYSISGNILNSGGVEGKFNIFSTEGRMRISFEENLSVSDDVSDILRQAHENYSGLFDSTDEIVYSWYDYTFSGEINNHIYSYQASDDYGENLFNATVNNTGISQVYSSENAADNAVYFDIALPCYTKTSDLPAITYSEALGLLYEGNYYSSYTAEISESTEVDHIEMVYLTPEYNAEIPGYTGCSLPFYKFYIKVPGSEKETAYGITKEYYTCYVCAINPEYVQLDEKYYKFN